MNDYLGTDEAAALLGISERKLYDLVASGSVPCSKVTGKWLFPRAALDRWVELGLQHPPGFLPAEPPPIIGGSTDPLLEWAARASGSGLALLSEGSERGLERLAAGEVALAAIHLHVADPDVDANVEAVRATPRLHDGVLIAFARREQGLLVAPGNPMGLGSLADAAGRGARLARRQSGAGAERLLLALLARSAIAAEGLRAGPLAATGQDLAFAIRSGDADAGIATRAVARTAGLDFVPLAWERFDLAVRRRSAFEPGPQRLLALMRDPEFARHAAILGGLDIAGAGAVRFNR